MKFSRMFDKLTVSSFEWQELSALFWLFRVNYITLLELGVERGGKVKVKWPLYGSEVKGQDKTPLNGSLVLQK